MRIIWILLLSLPCYGFEVSGEGITSTPSGFTCSVNVSGEFQEQIFSVEVVQPDWYSFKNTTENTDSVLSLTENQNVIGSDNNSGTNLKAHLIVWLEAGSYTLSLRSYWQDTEVSQILLECERISPARLEPGDCFQPNPSQKWGLLQIEDSANYTLYAEGAEFSLFYGDDLVTRIEEYEDTFIGLTRGDYIICLNGNTHSRLFVERKEP